MAETKEKKQKKILHTIYYIPYTIFFLAFLGFLDSVYLTVLHFKNALPPCTVNGCEFVLTSKYAQVGPIPTALLGVIFYGLVLVTIVILLELRKKKFLWTLVVLTKIGFVVSLVLLFIQAGILRHFCQYCVASEVIATLLFLLTLALCHGYQEKI